jgi:hypothetical protein
MTALQKLIDKGNSGVPTPLETCVLKQTFKSGGLTTEAAAELSLMKIALDTQADLLKMYREEFRATRSKARNDQAKLWNIFISTLDNQDVDWRASQQSLAIGLLERYDEWASARSKG